MNKAFPIILITGAALYFWNKAKQGASELSVKITGGSFNKRDSERALYTKIYINLELLVNNAGSIQGTISGGRVEVFASNKLLGFIPAIPLINLGANSATKVTVPVAINTLALFTNVVDFINNIGKGKALSLTVRGVVNTNLGAITINEVVNVSL